MAKAQIILGEMGGSPSKVEKFEFTSASSGSTYTLSIDFEPDVFVFYDSTSNVCNAWLNPSFFGYSGSRQLAWWFTNDTLIGIAESPTYNPATKEFTFGVGTSRNYTALAIKYVE